MIIVATGNITVTLISVVLSLLLFAFLARRNHRVDQTWVDPRMATYGILADAEIVGRFRNAGMRGMECYIRYRFTKGTPETVLQTFVNTVRVSEAYYDSVQVGYHVEIIYLKFDPNVSMLSSAKSGTGKKSDN